MEGAGLALALLPLFLNQLDNYVQGLEVLGGLRDSRYRRKLDSYLTKLTAQQAIFLNTMRETLQDFPYHDHGVKGSSLTLCELDVLWKTPTLQSFLQNRLSSNYKPFLRTMEELSRLLIDLKHKLGWENLPEEVPWRDTPKFKRQLQKIKDVFRKSVYDDLFSRIDLANQHLEKLIDRSSQLVRPANERETSFTRLKQVRRLAHSLHNIIVNGQYWKCTHPDEHVICFPLGSHSLHQSKGKTDSPTSFQFPVMISCWNPMTHCGTRMYREDSPPQWHHVDIESKFVGSSTLRGSSASTARISDICDALSNTRIGNSNQKSLGYIKEGDFEHTMRLRKMVDPSATWRKSLANLLESSNSIVEAERDGSYFFSKHDRLRLAVKLAYGVLELHGSWIQTQWKASDIIFLEPPSSRTSNPFVEWDIGHKITRSNMCQEGLNTALVRSKVLFPLALVLVELSLGQNLDSLRTPEDEDQQEASSAFKTAFRLLRYVGLESGPQYMNVVERCLFWNGAEVTSSSLEIEDTQGEAFHQILLPLFDNLNSWEDSLSRSV